jgi:DNA modification methylase
VYAESRFTLRASPPAISQAPRTALGNMGQLSLLNIDISNHLYRGDCLNMLDLIPDSSVDLIYIDPPFYSQRYYETFWGEEADHYAFEDRWKGGMQTYLIYSMDRIRKMYGKLKPTGSFYLHLDSHISH